MMPSATTWLSASSRLALAITGHVRGDGSDGERFREQTELSCVPSHHHGSCKRRPGGCRIALQHGQEAT
jgi:hypothetical protein